MRDGKDPARAGQRRLPVAGPRVLLGSASTARHSAAWIAALVALGEPTAQGTLAPVVEDTRASRHRSRRAIDSDTTAVVQRAFFAPRGAQSGKEHRNPAPV